MLILMFFLHIVDDFYLQGILAKLKQIGWWKKNAPNPLYRYDYIVGLVVHSFSWAFMIMLPFRLFILLMTALAVGKLLCLIKSHSFIFGLISFALGDKSKKM